MSSDESEDERKQLKYEDYTVGWLSAILFEEVAATTMLDEEHEDLPGKRGDDNTYTLGRIGEHNVVIARPTVYGTNSAANAVTNMARTFPNMRFVLMVGVGGGAPGPPVPEESIEQDIRLGDVVVGVPKDAHGGILQYDSGKIESGGSFTIKSFLSKPPKILLAAAGKLQQQHDRGKGRMARYLKTGLKTISKTPKGAFYRFPGRNKDMLFTSTSLHSKEGVLDCSACDQAQIEIRRDRCSDDPVVHHGLIASGNSVMRSAARRDELRNSHGVICFEMEAAGLMDNFPCLVVRGICDYSDDHKHKVWQPYAAFTAAAYAKDLLRVVQTAEVATTDTIACALGGVTEAVQEVGVAVEKFREEHAAAERERQKDRAQQRLDSIIECVKNPSTLNSSLRSAALTRRHPGTCEWLFEEDGFTQWEADGAPDPILWVHGKHGTGKTVLCASTMDYVEKTYPDAAILYLFINGDVSQIELLRHLGHQLLLHIKRQSLETSEYLENIHMHTDVTHIGMLETMVRSLIAETSRTFIFIDGLDEAEFNDGPEDKSKSTIFVNRRGPEMGRFMEFLINQAQSPPEPKGKNAGKPAPQVRLWCTSQETPAIQKYFQGRNYLDLKISRRKTFPDIMRYLQSAIPDFPRLAGEEDPLLAKLDELMNTALKADGSFLWARSVHEDLEQATDIDDLENVMRRVPRTLKGYYETAMKRIIRRGEDELLQPGEMPTWQIVLSLLVFSKRHLRISEVKEGVAMLRTKASMNLNVNRRPITKRIQEFLVPFVRMIDHDSRSEDESTILLSHSAVRMFLLEGDIGKEKLCDGKDFVTSDVVRETCLRYLSQPRYSKLLQKIGPDKFITDDSPTGNISTHYLLSYAAKYWHQHFDTAAKADSKQGAEVGVAPDPQVFKAVQTFLRSSNFATCIQVQSLCVLGHFMQSYDTITDRLVKTKRVLPNWLFDTDIFHQYAHFTSEWGELLNCGISRKISGEMDRCLWGSLGPGHFLSGAESRYNCFVFKAALECPKLARACQIQKLSPDGKRLISSSICLDGSNGTLHINHWSLETPMKPKLAATRTIKFDKDRVELDSYGMPCSKVFPLIPSLRCLASPEAFSFYQNESLVRIGTTFFKDNKRGASTNQMAGENFLVDSWEDICSRDRYLVACRRRIPTKKPYTVKEYDGYMVGHGNGSDDDMSDSSKADESWSEASTDYDAAASDDSFDSDDEDEEGDKVIDFDIKSDVGGSSSDADSLMIESASDDTEELSEDFDDDTGSSDEELARPVTVHDVRVDQHTAKKFKGEMSGLQYDPNDSDNESFRSTCSMQFDPKREAKALQAITDNPYHVRIQEKAVVNLICDLCSSKIKHRTYKCLVCPVSPGMTGNFDMCTKCERKGKWCYNDSHQIYDMINNRAVGVISRSKFAPKHELKIYDTKAAGKGGKKGGLLFRYSRQYDSMLYDSPPVIHPTHPLVVWPLSGARLLFADFQRNSFFEQKIETTGFHSGRPICVNISFSPCGKYLRVAKIEAVAQNQVAIRLKNKTPQEFIRPMLCLVLHVSILQLHPTRPTRIPPKMIGTTSFGIGHCERPLVERLPFSFTWGNCELYVCVSSSRLRIYKVDLDRLTLAGSTARMATQRLGITGKNAIRKFSNLPLNKTLEIANSIGQVQQNLIVTPKEIIFLPRSARNRSVQFIPPAAEGSVSTVVIGPRYGQHPAPSIALYLTAKDMGEWVDVREKEGDEAQLFGSNQRVGVPFEEFNEVEDCDIIPVSSDRWHA